MSDNRALLEDAGAIVRGHFVLASGMHAEWYVNKTAGLVLASHMNAHAEKIVNHFSAFRIEAVVGPELGAIALMGVVTQKLFEITGVNVAGIMATKIPGTKPVEFEIGRDQQRFIKNKRALVLEDIMSTGDSARATVESVLRAEGKIVGVGVLWNRGNIKPTHLGTPELFSVVDDVIPTFPANECPFCAARVPINTNLGKGREFLKANGLAS